MKQISTHLNEDEYKCFKQQCTRLGESEYQYVKRAVFERMTRNGSVIAKIQHWLLEDHPIIKKKSQ